MNKEDFIKMLEEMPLRNVCKLEIGENEYALKMVRKMDGNKNATMEDIKQHNERMKAWEEGYREAVKELREWRNQQYLKLKNLL